MKDEGIIKLLTGRRIHGELLALNPISVGVVLSSSYPKDYILDIIQRLLNLTTQKEDQSLLGYMELSLNEMASNNAQKHNINFVTTLRVSKKSPSLY